VIENDTVKMVSVQTGIQDDSYIQILSGLVEKQEIVIGPYTAVSRKLKQGDRIRRENDKTKDKDKDKKKK
jgi:HlyD family secretion protein